MGAFLMLIDAILFLFFLLMATAPMVDAQLVFPLSLFPEWMVEYKNWYVQGFNDYCYVERPPFFVGLVLVQLVFQWPLALANLYGMLAGKSWYNTTCLVYGASFFITMVTALTDRAHRLRQGLGQVVAIELPVFGVQSIGHTTWSALPITIYYKQGHREEKDLIPDRSQLCIIYLSIIFNFLATIYVVRTRAV